MQFWNFFTVKFRKNLRRNVDLKLPPPLKSLAKLYSGTFVLARIICFMSSSICFKSFYLFIYLWILFQICALIISGCNREKHMKIDHQNQIYCKNKIGPEQGQFLDHGRCRHSYDCRRVPLCSHPVYRYQYSFHSIYQIH